MTINKYESNRWVACSDGLPVLEDDNVLALFPNGSVETVHIEDYFAPITAGLDEDGNQLYTKYYVEQGISYWHPLPTSPDQ